MSYRSVSPQLRLSCYNCRFYQVSDDMLNGFCHRTPERKKAAIGIGTCNDFTAKGASDFSWPDIVPHSSEEPVSGVR